MKTRRLRTKHFYSEFSENTFAEENTNDLNRIMWATLARVGVAEIQCHFFDPFIEYFEQPEHGAFYAEFDSVSVDDKLLTMLWLQALINAPTNKRAAKEAMHSLIETGVHGL